MTDRPIIYSARMALAAYEGRKTMTRRPVRKLLGIGEIYGLHRQFDTTWWNFRSKKTGELYEMSTNALIQHCPYGQPGDRLYARETFWNFGYMERYYDAAKNDFRTRFIDRTDENHPIKYAASECGQPVSGPMIALYHRRPSIFLPKWASRTVRKILEVRVERLQDISEEDAIREGFDSREDFITGWDKIYKANGHGWDENEFVWVVGFEGR